MINKDLENVKYRIWYRQYDTNGNVIDEGCYHKEYVTYGHAYNRAVKEYLDKAPGLYYVVAKRYPWNKYTTSYTCGLCGAEFEVQETASGYSWSSSIDITADRCTTHDRTPLFVRSVCPTCANKVIDFIESLRRKDNN